MAYVALLSLCLAMALAKTWTGKIAEEYIVDAPNSHIEGIAYYDDHIYGGSKGAYIYDFDEDDLSNGKEVKPKTSSFANPNSGLINGLDVSSKKKWIYGALAYPFGGGAGGVVAWDIDDLEQQAYITVEGTTFGNDVIVGDDYVWWTDHLTGEIYSCDLDLTACNLVSNDPLLGYRGVLSGVNGVIYMDDYLIAGNYDDGTLINVPVKDGQTNGSLFVIDIPDPNGYIKEVNGILRINDDVIVFTAPHWTVLVESSDNFQTGEIKKAINTQHIGDEGTTCALASGGTTEIDVYVTFPSVEAWTAVGGSGQEKFEMILIKFSDADVDDLDWSLTLVMAAFLAFC